MVLNVLWIFCSLLVLLFTGIIGYFKNSFQYWKRRGVPCLEAQIPFGSIKRRISQKTSLQKMFQEQYTECKSRGHRYIGYYMLSRPDLFVVDPEIIKCILSKDFNHFMQRGIYHIEEDALSAHLFSLETSKWKKLRPKLTPTFTSGKMKMMFNIVVACARQLKTHLDEISLKGPVDVKYGLECYTMDIIGSCAFGIDCNSFTDPSSDFCKYTKRIFVPTVFESMKTLFTNVYSNVSKTLRLKVIPEDITTFFVNIVKNSVMYRKENNITRDDFMQLLIELMDNTKKTDSISFNEMVAQVFVFFLAGFETSSATMTFCLLELCLNPEIQEKLRCEVKSTLEKFNGEICYDSIKEMKYMNDVIDETLRKYPPLPVLNRQCIKDYKLPNSDLVIKKDIKLIIPLIGLQNDPDYFPDPEKFDPNRFSAENKERITPYTFMPFGEGPRACIGIRFGIMQTKVGLSILLKNYKFSINEKMQLPIQFRKNSIMTAVEGGVWLNVEKIDS